MNTPYVFKKCSKCGEWLVASEINFNKRKYGKYGLYSECKKCRTKQHKQYYKSNKNKIVEQQKQYRDDNKDKIAEYKKQYYKDNKDKILERQKQYYKDNKDKIKQYYKDNKDTILEYQKQHYEDNKDTILERKRQYNKQYCATPQGQAAAFNKRCRRRTKEQNQGNGITSEQWLECMTFFNWKCAYSGQVLSKDTRSLDHIKPLNNGGEHEIWNLIPMYKPYNSSKNDKDLLEWYKEQDFYSEERLQKIYEWQEYAYKKYANKI